MIYTGIDLAWKEDKVSGLAFIDDNKRVSFCCAHSWNNKELAALTADQTSRCSSTATKGSDSKERVIISIDSPLQVTNETGGRPCDSELMRYRFSGRALKVFATSRSYMDKHYGGVRGEELLILLGREKFGPGGTVVETFPTAVKASLFPHLFEKGHKISSRLPLDQLKTNAALLIKAIQILGFSGAFPDPSSCKTKKEYKNFEDCIDALLCALNSWYYEKEKSYHSFGEGINGYTVIALPKVK